MRRGTKGNFTKIGIVGLALLLSLGAMGGSYAAWSDSLVVISTVHRSANFDDPFSWVVCNDDGVPDEVTPYGVIDPGDDGIDPSAPQSVQGPRPSYDKDVATTEAWLEPDPDYPSGLYSKYITVTINNAYPCYYPTIFYGIRNSGEVPAKIVSIQVDEHFTGPDDVVLDDIPELTVTVTGIHACQTEIERGEEVIGDLDIHVEQSAAECTTYTIRVMIVTAPYCAVGGTPGYWQNWKAHWDCSDLTTWLQAVDTASPNDPDDWLVPDLYPVDDHSDGTIDCHDWDEIRKAGISGATDYNKFLMHYTATRLNVEAGRLSTGISLDISSYLPDEWFGENDPNFDPENATLGEVIAKIENKWVDHHDGTSLTKQQFNIMKNVCVAFNELGPS